jgi:hypothetical protein
VFKQDLGEESLGRLLLRPQTVLSPTSLALHRGLSELRNCGLSGGPERKAVPAARQNCRLSVLESRNLLKNPKQIKEKSEKYSIKMG